MLDRAKFLVVSEITEVLGEKTPVVEEKVDKALERCFATKARNAAAREGGGHGASAARRAEAPPPRRAARGVAKASHGKPAPRLAAASPSGTPARHGRR